MDLELGTVSKPVSRPHASRLSTESARNDREYKNESKRPAQTQAIYDSAMSKYLIARCICSTRQSIQVDGSSTSRLQTLVQKDANKHLDWYMSYLNHCVDSFLNCYTIEGSVVRDNFNHILPPQREKDFVFHILRLTGDALRSNDRCLRTLASNCPDFHEKVSASPTPDRVRHAYHQIVFLSVSWITSLFVTDASTSIDCLTLTLQDSFRPGKTLRSSSWRVFRLPLDDDIVDQPLHHLLSNFGSFKPKRRRGARNRGRTTQFEDKLLAANLNYYTLLRVAHIRVEWVDAISLHLEFDDRSSVLKLFRFPTLCALLTCSAIEEDSNVTFLSQLFAPEREDSMYSDSGHHHHRNGEGDDDDDDISSTSDAYSRDHLVEILCSYRLIFGQHKRARSAFRKLKWTAAQQASMDPLLKRLCGRKPSEQSIYDKIDAPRLKTVYSVSADFPILGSKLADLQDYVTAHDASDFMTLWYDRRDVLRFYTFWAVVFVGGFSILLSIVQVGLTAVQVATGGQPGSST